MALETWMGQRFPKLKKSPTAAGFKSGAPYEALIKRLKWLHEMTRESAAAPVEQHLACL